MTDGENLFSEKVLDRICLGDRLKRNCGNVPLTICLAVDCEGNTPKNKILIVSEVKQNEY